MNNMNNNDKSATLPKKTGLFDLPSEILAIIGKHLFSSFEIVVRGNPGQPPFNRSAPAFARKNISSVKWSSAPGPLAILLADRTAHAEFIGAFTQHVPDMLDLLPVSDPAMYPLNSANLLNHEKLLGRIKQIHVADWRTIMDLEEIESRYVRSFFPKELTVPMSRERTLSPWLYYSYIDDIVTSTAKDDSSKRRAALATTCAAVCTYNGNDRPRDPVRFMMHKRWFELHLKITAVKGTNAGRVDFGNNQGQTDENLRATMILPVSNDVPYDQGWKNLIRFEDVSISKFDLILERIKSLGLDLDRVDWFSAGGSRSRTS
jgi:hypothetical protein